MNELNDKYILGPDKIPVAEPDLYKWAQWFQCNDDARVVARDQIGESRVSTVFLGLDHNFMGDGPPILWETMVFGGHMDSVPNGGWLDGCLNVLAGLEVMRRIASEGTPPVTVRLVDWADEEGARFGRSLLGSSVTTMGTTVGSGRGGSAGRSARPASAPAASARCRRRAWPLRRGRSAWTLTELNTPRSSSARSAASRSS